MTDANSPEKPESARIALAKVGRQVRGNTLLPWMMAYAEWLILECADDVPKRTARTRTARGLARAPVGDRHLYILEAREDFDAYCKALRAGPLEQARLRFAQAFPSYIDAHKSALDMARDARDYKAIAQITEPVLDRVFPKKAEGVVATQVNIMLTPQQLQGFASYKAPEVLVEQGDTTSDMAPRE